MLDVAVAAILFKPISALAVGFFGRVDLIEMR